MEIFYGKNVWISLVANICLIFNSTVQPKIYCNVGYNIDRSPDDPHIWKITNLSSDLGIIESPGSDIILWDRGDIFVIWNIDNVHLEKKKI